MRGKSGELNGEYGVDETRKKNGGMYEICTTNKMKWMNMRQIK